ncbi:MAG: hypothetical protein K8S54_17025 [Spirochaetia bacterium]|nr:hypothetical protein [Spirochaetia bacterium]
MTDPRSLSLVLFHAISRKLRLYEELTPRQARAILMEALRLLPDFQINETEQSHILRISSEGVPDFLFNVRDAVDSLLVLHREYRELSDPDHSEN